jgi:hypothetical protein
VETTVATSMASRISACLARTGAVAKSASWWAVSLACHGLVLSLLAHVVFVTRPARFAGPMPESSPAIESSPASRGGDGRHPVRRWTPGAECVGPRADPSPSPERPPGGPDANPPTSPPGSWASDRRERLAAAISGLRWLARHQAADGHWDSDGFASGCGTFVKGSCDGPGSPDTDAGNTGLALLAFLGAGYTHLSRDVYDGIAFGQVVKKGLRWMMANQDSEGCIGGQSAPKYMVNHAIAALAIAEAFGMTSSQILKEPASKAARFLVAAQKPGQGWRYTARCCDSDTWVTGWCVMALQGAEGAGVRVPRAAYDGARAWLDGVTDPSGRAAYGARESVPAVVPGREQAGAGPETMTAVAMLARILIDRQRQDPRLEAGADRLARDPPVAGGPRLDYDHLFHASLALWQVDGASGTRWAAWGGAMSRALCATQRPSSAGCAGGSWDPVDRWGPEGGRIYATSINILSLLVDIRSEPVFGRRPAGR